LAGGLLSGRYHRGSTPTDGRFATSALAPMYRDRYWTEPFLVVVDQLAEVAAQAGISLPELSLRWCLSNPQVGGVLVGASRPEQAQANLRALARGPLPEDLRLEIGRVTQPVQDSSPRYAR
jgi:aryl-alcohol dehydrogenase-like predicted oxidoreductase